MINIIACVLKFDENHFFSHEELFQWSEFIGRELYKTYLKVSLNNLSYGVKLVLWYGILILFDKN
jgi:hypothetical protein